MNYFLRFNSILGASVIASIFIHIIFFIFFVVSFPTKFQSHQPYLISLGAIIPREDLLQGQSNDRLQTKGKFQPLPSYSKRQEDFSSLRRLDKPSIQKPLKINEKTTQKSMFPTEQRSTTSNNTELLKLENDLGPYKPLQIP